MSKPTYCCLCGAPAPEVYTPHSPAPVALCLACQTPPPSPSAEQRIMALEERVKSLEGLLRSLTLASRSAIEEIDRIGTTFFHGDRPR